LTAIDPGETSLRIGSIAHGRLLEVGEHQDVEQLGAWGRTEGVEALPESAFELIGSHGLEATRSPRPR
jgi:hypothetical protein